jgi:hypothetical protein
MLNENPEGKPDKAYEAGLWLAETIVPSQRLRAIVDEIVKNKSLNEKEIFDKLYEEGQNNQDFEGILESTIRTTPKGKKVYIVKLASQYYPPNLMTHFGCCFPTNDPNINVIFINSNLSPNAEKALIDHEMFHARDERGKNPYWIEEPYTIWNTSVLKNQKESVQLVLEQLPEIPGTILKYIGYVGKRVKNLVNKKNPSD